MKVPRGELGEGEVGGLVPAPESVLDATGAPNFGVYSGRVRNSALSGLTGRWQRSNAARLASEKKWQYVAAANRNLVVGGAVVQLGYLASAFVYVFDRVQRRHLVERSFIVPPQLARVSDSPHQASAELRRVRSRISIDAGHAQGRFRASLSGGVEIELALDTARGPEPLTAVCQVAGTNGVNLTQKSTCVPAEGTVRIGPSTYRVSDAFAVLDYTHGLLARETRWFWASGCGRLADGRMLGLNLVSGFNDGEVHENALWLDGQLLRTGRARFEFDEANPLAPWRILTEDGAVDLRFAPEGMRAENVDVKLVVSRYAQPIGSFSGTVRDADGRSVVVEGVPGVTEHHLARW